MGTSMLLLFYLQESYQILTVKIREKFLPASIKGRKVTFLTYARAFCYCEQGLPSGKTIYQSLTYRGFVRAQLA